MRRPLAVLSAAVLATAGVAGCSAPAADPVPTSDVRIQVVASIDVYADLAELVGGEYVEVTVLLDDPAQNPHTFAWEDSAGVSALADADVVILNGGGYDDAVLELLETSRNTHAKVIEVMEYLAHIDDPHVWYSYNEMKSVALGLGLAYEEVDPERASSYDTKAMRAVHWLGLIDRNAYNLRDKIAGANVILTEPAPRNLVDVLDLVDVTPPGFGEAVQSGADVPADALQAMLDLIGGGTVALVFANEQTGGPATDAVLAAAAQHGVPVVTVSETIPADVEARDDDMTSRYIWWQVGILRDIHVAFDLPDIGETPAP
jgi:zinc/manganese transport system substrate-binding protein